MIRLSSLVLLLTACSDAPGEMDGGPSDGGEQATDAGPGDAGRRDAGAPVVCPDIGTPCPRVDEECGRMENLCAADSWIECDPFSMTWQRRSQPQRNNCFPCGDVECPRLTHYCEHRVRSSVETATCRDLLDVGCTFEGCECIAGRVSYDECTDDMSHVHVWLRN